MHIGASGPSNWPTHRPSLNNVVGSALVVGGCYQVDQRAANAATTDLAGKYDNVKAVVTAGLLRNKFVIAESAIPASSRGTFTALGYAKARVSGAVAVGDSLIPVNGAAHLISNGTNTGYATALEANSSGTALVDVDFWGGLGFAA